METQPTDADNKANESLTEEGMQNVAADASVPETESNVGMIAIVAVAVIVVVAIVVLYSKKKNKK